MKNKSGTLKTFSDVVSYRLADDKFSNFATLFDICDTFQASSADAERGLFDEQYQDEIPQQTGSRSFGIVDENKVLFNN